MLVSLVGRKIPRLIFGAIDVSNLNDADVDKSQEGLQVRALIFHMIRLSILG